MLRMVGGLTVVLLLGSAAAQTGEVRVPDIASTPLPRAIQMGGTTYIDKGLVATGSLAAGTVDFLGDTLGSFSSLMIEPGSWKREGDTYTGTLWTLPDRGRNDPEHDVFFDYRGRLHRFRFSMTVGRARLVLVPDGGRELCDFDGRPFTGAEPRDGLRTERGIVLPSPAKGVGAGKVSLDAESLQFTRDGGFYVGDEYAANVYRFDAKGRLAGVLVPPRSVQPLDADGKPDFTSLRAPASGRRNNQGVEGMALSPDGKRLFVVLQSALVQDSVPGDASGRTLTRVLVYDVSRNTVPKRPVAHYVVRLPAYDDKGDGGAPNKTAAQSEIRAIDDHRFLMLARDGNGYGAENGKPIVFKSVLLVDTDGASNLAGTRYETSTTPVLGQDGSLRAEIHPATWKPLVDLLDPADLARFGLSIERDKPGMAMLSEKWEAMDLVPVLDPAYPDDWFLLVGNDNDFIAKHCVMEGQRCDSAIDNDNRILVYRLTLPGMRSTAASHHH
ncbi:esterase-like activity of phytase family protein [Luteibacter sp. E-22]|uniref:esterase-like activity of phytase family protein n=1 Tax=Luteibacter sp. E-22 TaxID=3404050 RepID=UPI003CE791A6